MRYTRRVIGGIFILACAGLVAQQAAPARSSGSGVYTAAQGAAGATQRRLDGSLTHW